MNNFAKTAFMVAGVWSAGAAVLFTGHVGLEILQDTTNATSITSNILSTFSNDFFKTTSNTCFAMSGMFGLMGAGSCALPKRLQKRLKLNNI